MVVTLPGVAQQVLLIPMVIHMMQKNTVDHSDKGKSTSTLHEPSPTITDADVNTPDSN